MNVKITMFVFLFQIRCTLFVRFVSEGLPTGELRVRGAAPAPLRDALPRPHLPDAKLLPTTL
jgi:hypothetical protein